MENNPFSLYVHVPFCRSKCPYCAFYSFRPRTGQIELWTDCAVKELAALPRRLSFVPRLRTIYIGGGTPSCLPRASLEALFSALAALPRTENCEFTIEANPDSLDAETLALWSAHGVTRVSIGVQSLDDRELKLLARPHTAAQALAALDLCLNKGFRVSADLMFALPGQTLRVWHRSMSAVVRAGVTHISVYQLTIEQDSFWGTRPPAGLPDGYPFYRWAQYYLPKKGLKQYEIASFCRAGHESLHNLAYWRRQNVLAVGPGAWGFLDGERFANYKSLDRWAEAVERGESPVEYRERKTGAAAASEAAILALRTAEGVDLDDFARRHGPSLRDELMRRLRDLPQEYLSWSGGRAALSPRGMRIGNAIWTELLDLD